MAADSQNNRPDDSTSPITFSVSGQAGAAPLAATRGMGAPAAPALPGRVKASVRVSTMRDAGTPQRITAVPGQDIVALHIEDGPTLLLHPATARDLLLGPAGPSRGGDDVAVRSELAWPGVDPGGATRGLGDIGRVFVSTFQVLTGLLEDPAADLAASLVVQHVDGQVDAGVYALQPNLLAPLKGSPSKRTTLPPAAGPMLVLVHGTFVETTSTFGKLWLAHRDGVDRLFAQYAGAVYALDHPTLGASPIANARTLVDSLPDGARLHLVTHSRGGLVAEVLARVAGAQGVGADDLAFFADPAYAAQQAELRELGELVKAKGVQVERVVRVACPARGTLLASGRLDAYLSVLKWTLELAGLPVLPTFVDFIGEVARRRADPAQIPGLAAMIPDTPLVNWLNAAPQPIPGDLRVVAGDLQHGDTLGSWLKALLADAYYRTDNDIVVHTASMYGGAPRAGGASFLLDQGPDTTHFSYFVNDRTAEAVVGALVEAQSPAGFQPIGPLSWAGLDAGGLRAAPAASATRGEPDPGRPAVFVLPGIVGSNLKQGQPPERLWLSARLPGNFARLAYQPAGADGVSEDGPVGSSYDALTAFLGATHEVIGFGYDWRRPLQDEAARLASALEQALDARRDSGQPVRLLAHSMGGLLARTVQIVAPATWQRLMAHDDARMLMLGTPNGGSWAPMQVLSGDDTFGNALAAIGSPLGNLQARKQMAAMPGFLQLQAGLTDPARALDQSATWRQLADDDYQQALQKNWWQRYNDQAMTAAYQWGVPPQDVLDQAKALRQQLDAQLGGALAACAGKLLLVVGQAAFTPAGFQVGPDGFTYLDAQDGGDGRVPLDRALLPGVKTWTLDCVHGDLPATAAAFDAYVELLQTGGTARLATLAAARAGAASPVVVPSRPSRRPPSALPAGSLREVLGAAPSAQPGAAPTPAALSISVLNGNLTFVQQPLMLGHYRSLELTGTEAVVDGHLGGTMSTSLAAGLYPDVPGTHRIFMNQRPDPLNPWQLPRPRAAIVVGLGEEVALTAAQLEATVSQGVKAWAQRAHEEGWDAGGGIELAATLLGSGGIAITAASAARAIARGVAQANQRLAVSGWPRVSRLVLVEWYLDRAAEAWRGLQLLAETNPRDFAVDPRIASGTGPLRRQPESGYRGTNYDLISVTAPSDGVVSFALDTRRARSEVRATHTQPDLVRKLVESAATAQQSDPRLGRTLFQLLVPLELKPFLGGTDRAVLQLDAGTAPIPWELLDTRSGDGEGADAPWSIRTRLLRKLSTADFRASPRDAGAEDAVLVIGAPSTPDAYPVLDGARREARVVADRLGATLPRGRVTALLDGEEFDAVIAALVARPYRIVHVAGHGEPVRRDSNGAILSRGGVVLSQGVFLGPDEIAKLPVVPELVFVNCCHLGAHAASQSLAVAKPVEFAAGVADELIKIGVRCVVAAGWAVDDDAAETFAQSFYAVLLRGGPFVDAVAQARQDALRRSPHSKTWAAYQCYGDPNWVFLAGGDGGQGPAAAAAPGEAIASAPGLALALEDLAVRTSFATGDVAAQRSAARARLIELDHRYSPAWAGMGAIAEAFAVAWNAADDPETAIGWYQRALCANDASASMKAHEQLGNLRARRAWKAARGAAPRSPVMDGARAELTAALRDLQAIAALQPTIERLSLCGSAWKRLGQLELRDERPAEGRAAWLTAAQAYGHAERIAAGSGHPGLFYPALNRMALDLVLRAGRRSRRGFDAAALVRARQSLQMQHATQPDFWTHAGFIELELYAAIARGALAGRAAGLAQQWAGLHERVAASGPWGSVADQAHFVLGPTQSLGDEASRRAVARLLDQLDGYAATVGGNAGESPPTPAPQRPPVTSSTDPVV